MRRASAIWSRSLALLLAAIGAPEGRAQGLIHELRGGVLYHDAPELWSGFSLEKKSADINLEVTLSPSLPFLWGVIRPAIGGSINTRGATSHGYIDARWEIEAPAGIFFGIGLGAAIHDGERDPDYWDRKALGSRVLFHIPFEAGVRFDAHNSVSFYFEHTSNANTKPNNEGLDRLGIRYGYRF